MVQLVKYIGNGMLLGVNDCQFVELGFDLIDLIGECVMGSKMTECAR